MIIASKLPPQHTEYTYFNSGRSAFAYLIGQIVKPTKVYLPAFTCWSLVSTMQKRFPEIDVEFYSIGRDLTCRFPSHVASSEAIVFIHFFGYVNNDRLPSCDGTLIEDTSHSYLSEIDLRGDFVFGSYRKITRVGDGGYLHGFHNPVYEPSRKLDTWLRYESTDWRDMREAENMLDRDWQICDISSQSLALLMAQDKIQIRRQRQENEKWLFEHLSAGRPLQQFKGHECPLLHQRLFDSTEERDSLRSFLATKNIFCSIHWPTHPLVAASQCDASDAFWMEAHSMAIPVSSEYSLNDMKLVVDAVKEWENAGA